MFVVGHVTCGADLSPRLALYYYQSGPVVPCIYLLCILLFVLIYFEFYYYIVMYMIVCLKLLFCFYWCKLGFVLCFGVVLHCCGTYKYSITNILLVLCLCIYDYPVAVIKCIGFNICI